MWRNTNNTVHIKAAPCGLEHVRDRGVGGRQDEGDGGPRGAANIIGMQLLRDFRQTDPSNWKGTVYVPDRDMNVSGTIMLLDRNTLKAVGCFLAADLPDAALDADILSGLDL